MHRPTKRSKPLPRLSHGQEAASPAGSSLSRRTLIPSSGLTLKMTNFRSFFALVPTVLAAARLEEFYDVIALKIETGQFSNWQPSRYIILSMWNFEFSVSCDKCFVPWSLVQDWVIDMAALSSQQFTGLYEATVRGEGPFSGFVFLIHMRLKDPR